MLSDLLESKIVLFVAKYKAWNLNQTLAVRGIGLSSTNENNWNILLPC